MLEARYVKPFFSSLELAVNPVLVGVTIVNNQTGQQGTIPQEQQPAIKANITGWLSGQQVRSDTVSFYKQPVDPNAPTMDQVIEGSGVPIIDLWMAAFDQITSKFPATAEQSVEAIKTGPPVYLRPDVFRAVLQPGQAQVVVISCGVYLDTAYTKRSAYFDLVFEDGQTKRNREQEIANCIARKAEEQAVLDGTNPNLANLTQEQLAQAISAAESNVKFYTTRLAELQSVQHGVLAELFAMPEVQQSVGALCQSIFISLKQAGGDYKDIDIATVMSEFALPDVS